MARQSDPNLGEVLAGKYRVERTLGQGGMGMVVAATHIILGHQVALKYLLPSAGLKAETIARFLREAQVTARLKSTHIAKTLDMGQFDDGRPFLVMELLEGSDLGEELSRRKGNVSTEEVAHWVLQACEGIAEAHTAGVIHRDLKPSNLFLARDASGGSVVKVLDFGISKLITSDGALTSSEAAFGSPLYMSPEQLRSSKNADVRSDVWSIGVILYEALSGLPPFNGESVFSVAQSVMSDTPVPLAERRKDLPPGLSALVMRCLAKQPADRPQSVADLADALAPFAGPGGAERAARARGASSERVIVAIASSDQSDKWTAATTQHNPTKRLPVRPGIALAVALFTLTGGAIVWRVRAAAHPAEEPATLTRGSLATAATSATETAPPPPVTSPLTSSPPLPSGPEAPPSVPIDAGATPTSSPKPVAIKKRQAPAAASPTPAPPAPATAPPGTPPPGPVIETRSNF